MDRLSLALPGSARPGVVWHAPLLNFSGYADEARAFVLGLRSRGVDLRAEAIGDPSPAFVAGLDPVMKVALDAAVRSPRPKYAVNVLHMPGETLQRFPGAGYHVARSMFETDGLPGAWVPRLNEMDEIWVPADFNVQTFRAAGVRAPLVVVPSGVDAAAFAGAEPLPIAGLRGTVFLSVFEWSFRKGWDVLLKAWAKAFSPSDDVTLLVRTYPMKRPGRQSGTADIERDLDEFLRRMGRSRSHLAPIVLLHDHIAEPDMPRLYATATAYVSPTRGEGWGRPYLEAMAAGLPVLGTRWSGNLDFMNDDNSLLIDIDGLEPVDSREELAFYRGQRWAKPSVKHLAQLLAQVAADGATAAAIGARAQRDAAARWTWDQAVEVAAARLDDIEARLRRAPAKPAEAVPVRWVGEQYSWHSLAHVNRELCRRLAGRHTVELEIQTRERDSDRTLRGDNVAGLEACTGEVLTRPPRVEVRHQWPPDWRPPRQGAWVVMQPWEFGGLPDDWIPHLVDEVDEVWCYSNFVRDCYVASGVPAQRLQVIPLGVDTNVFSPEGAAYPLATNRRTRLLFVGGTIERKGIDVLLDAYLAAFSPADDVCLVVKSFGGDGVYRDNTIDDRIRALAADPSVPAIELVTDELAVADMAALYRACDALVHPYRGEGFGLPIAEAMACGLAVAVTDYGAARDFCDADSAFLIPARVVPVPAGGLAPNATGYWWAEPDGSALVELLRRIVADPGGAREKAERGRARVGAALSWDTTAARVEARIAALGSTVPVRFRSGRVQARPAQPQRAAVGVESRRHGLVSGCMIVRDEEENLAACLASLAGLVDEVVVYDTGSVDRTVDVARRAGAVVVEGQWSDDFAAARNAALEACTGEWILWIDADELLCGDIAAFRAVLATDPKADAIEVTIDNLDAAGGSIGYSHRASRVFRRERAHWAGRLHETVVARPGQAPLAAGHTAHISFLHSGYVDAAVAAKSKGERNIRLAQAELADGTDRRGLVLVHLGRSLASAGRLDDALACFEEARRVTDVPAERRLALRHGAEALLDTGRPEAARQWIEDLRDASDCADMADYLEGIARAAAGDRDGAIDLLGRLRHVRDDDGFALADHVLQLRRAFLYRDARRWAEVADELLAIAASGLTPPWAMIVDANWRAGRDADEVAAAIPAAQLTAAVAQLLAVEPPAADGVAEALWRRWPDDAALLAGAAAFAPRLAPERCLEWSARLRKAGLSDRCPLVGLANDDARSPVDRIQATCLLFGAFADERAQHAVRAIAPQVGVAELLHVLIQMGELAPALLPGFVMAAACDSERTVAVASCLDALGAGDVAEELLASVRR